MILRKPVLLFVGTYPPRECGIATFNQDLFQSFQSMFRSRMICKVAALNATAYETRRYPAEVGWEINAQDPQDYRNLAKAVNASDSIKAVIVQHEYGIYGGLWGCYLADFLITCIKPVILTLHTVIPQPEPELHAITQTFLDHAEMVTVFTRKSKEILLNTYQYLPDRVVTIPHGIHPTLFVPPHKGKKQLRLQNRTILTTFGLLSRSKGLEYVISAIPKIIPRHSNLLYLILGETHPVVRRQEGEHYRSKLVRLVTTLGLEHHVKFYDKYLPLKDIQAFLQATDLYLATSLDPNQTVSGTISYALGSGRAAVSTRFAQAQDIISPQTGLLVPLRQTNAYAKAINQLLADPEQLNRMHYEAFLNTRSMLWPNVALRTFQVLSRVAPKLAPFLLPPLNLTHLSNMTDDFGLIQFAKGSKPHLDSGYTLDDNARALLACSQLLTSGIIDPKLLTLSQIFLNFIAHCQLDSGDFINYFNRHRHISSQNQAEDLADSYGRAVWALAVASTNEHFAKTLRHQATDLLQKALRVDTTSPSLRHHAFLIKGLVAALKNPELGLSWIRQRLIFHTNILVTAFEHQAQPHWAWFEDRLSYANGILPDALCSAYQALGTPRYKTIGVKSLNFLLEQTFWQNIYVPIGQAGWYPRNQVRAIFDQQPEDPTATLMALESALAMNGHQPYKKRLLSGFSWFLGNNLLGLPLYHYKNGGCYDGLTTSGVNRNQGAESLVSFLLARTVIDRIYFQSKDLTC